MATIHSAVPVLPVRDVGAACAHYQALGFEVSRYQGGDGYAFVQRDGCELHLARAAAEHDPATTAGTVYLYVDDPDALIADWRAAGVDGRFMDPSDTAWRMREGAHVDPDGNLLRIGRPLGGG